MYTSNLVFLVKISLRSPWLYGAPLELNNLFFFKHISANSFYSLQRTYRKTLWIIVKKFQCAESTGYLSIYLSIYLSMFIRIQVCSYLSFLICIYLFLFLSTYIYIHISICFSWSVHIHSPSACPNISIFLCERRVGWLGFILFTNPSARAGYDTRSIFKRSLTGF